MSDNTLRIKNLDKSFPGVHALNNISFEAVPGEVLGLVGVNGAGKSTLMNILGGILQPDSGEILIRGKSETIKNPHIAEQLGIAFIQQEIQVFDNLTVFENVLATDMGKWKHSKAFPFLNKPKMREEASRYLKMLGSDINVNLKGYQLSVGEQQMVQIARALSQGGEILLFDEPTTSLSEREKENLFTIIRKLKDSGLIIIYITHYLDEIFEICDRVVVMRDGEKSGEDSVQNLDKKKIINFMIGRDIEELADHHEQLKGETIMTVKGLSGEKLPKDVSFSLYKGEVLGIWGLMGSGRTETIRTLLGFDRKKSGEILFAENEGLKPVTKKELQRSIGYVTESRHYDGLFLPMPIWQNITSVNILKFASRYLRFLNNKNERTTALDYMQLVNVKAVDEAMIVSKLSGGNQQKVIIAKWFSKNTSIIIMDEPTKGIDVSAKVEIQKLIRSKAAEGMSFIVVSSEMEEIMMLCDRIVCLSDGVSIKAIEKHEFSKDSLTSGIIRKELQNA